MSVRIVLVTYSPGESLTDLLASLPAACSSDYEVILADNGSTDGSIEAAALADPRHVRITRTGGNLGYGSAANIGAQGSKADWLIVANPDIIFGPGSIDELVAAAERWPRGGAFGPRIWTHGEIYPSARMVPSVTTMMLHVGLEKRWPRNRWTRKYQRSAVDLPESESGWLSGSVQLFRPVAWQQVEGFDTSYFMFMEDLDLGERLGKAGWQNIYVPTAEVEHTLGHSVSKAPTKMRAAHVDSAVQYYVRKHPGLIYWPLRLLLRILQRRLGSRAATS